MMDDTQYRVHLAKAVLYLVSDRDIHGRAVAAAMFVGKINPDAISDPLVKDGIIEIQKKLALDNPAFETIIHKQTAEYLAEVARAIVRLCCDLDASATAA